VSTGAPSQTGTSTSSSPAKQSAAAPSALAAAEAICARRSKELAGIPLAGANLPAVAAAARRHAAIQQRALSELEQLTPPGKDAAAYRTLIADEQAALLQVVKLGERAQSGDSAAARAARTKIEVGGLRLLVAASRAGVKRCAVSG
jgi:hypothetical protein